jgi:hypothetical protein
MGRTTLFPVAIVHQQRNKQLLHIIHSGKEQLQHYIYIYVSATGCVSIVNVSVGEIRI